MKSYPQSSFIDIMTPSDIAYVIAIVKNSGEMWDQNVRMTEMGQRARVFKGEEVTTIVHPGGGNETR